MMTTYGARDITRNPSLLRINANDSYVIEDKKAHKTLGIYLGVNLAQDFFEYTKKQALLKSAHKIKHNSHHEYAVLEGTLSDGL